MKITIDRSMWRTGRFSEKATGEGETRLRNKEGYRCCLGFICEKSRPELDIPPTAGCPASVGAFPGLSTQGQIGSPHEFTNTALTKRATEINDSILTQPWTKERLLLKLFKDTIYELEFVGEYK